MKTGWKRVLTACAGTVGAYALMNVVAKKVKEDRDMNDDPCMKPDCQGEVWEGQQNKARVSAYEGKVKPVIDRSLSFLGLVFLSPVFVIISLAIVINDPGPVLFTQKRVGKDKQFFMLHKFRSMKMKAPHDIPTHQLENPEQYITQMGKFLRKYSLDELPQIWDIFRGRMSIIGPRPALWNQDDLVAERDKYGANDILPGLTGWAQINGRDELEIAEKARLDGEYAEKLRQGGGKALFFDIKCFLGTVFSVLSSEGVVEGGTGELHKAEKRMDSINAADTGFQDYGCLKHFDIDISEKNRKRVLITGAGSYIGESFEKWAQDHYSANFTIDTVDMRDPNWRSGDFSSYDVVFHVAGIAHADVGKATEEEKKKYYAVNTNLAIEAAKKAKAEGVRQFVFMSSMIIYGDSAPYGKEKVIDEHTVPAPSNFYGDSKWQADQGVRRLASEDFHVAVLRPPMIYGKGSKGNYPILAKLAKKLPIFPDVENKRSMLYIGNLCEFLCKLMLSGEGGVYFPQNEEYTKTSEMVRMISVTAGKKVWVTKLLKPAVVLGSHVPGKISRLVGKAFGGSYYEQNISQYDGLHYQKVKLSESINETENTEESEHSDIAEEHMLVSIVTGTFNSAKTVRKTIESVLAQTYDNIEYIIADGESTDDTLEIAKSYRHRFEEKGIKYTILCSKDTGMYAGMNKGIAVASGEIIGIVNSDDYYEPNTVETVVNTYNSSHFDMFYADLNIVDNAGRKIRKKKSKLMKHYYTTRYWNHPTTFIPKRIYDIRRYDESFQYYGDWDLMLWIFKRYKNIIVINKPLSNYSLGGKTTHQGFEAVKKKFNERRRGYKNNGYNPLYVLECMFIDFGKEIIMRILRQ